MFRKVLISSTTPRSLDHTNFAFIEGLGIQRWLFYFFLIGAILLLFISLIQFQNYLLAALFLAISILSFWQVKKVSNQVNERKEIYQNGEIVRAKVLDHSKTFVFYKSSKNYVISAQIEGSSDIIKIENSSKVLWNSAPINSQILGLKYEDKYLFGEELNCQFTTQ